MGRTKPTNIAERFILQQKDPPGFVLKFIDEFTGAYLLYICSCPARLL